MKVITKAVMDWDGNILEEESHEYTGPVAACFGGGGETETTTTTEPWAGVQPFLGDVYTQAHGQFRDALPMYGGQTYAGFSPHQQGGMYGGLDYMRDTFAPQAQSYVSGLQGMMDAPQNITQNPAVMAMMDANRGAVTDVLQGEWLPGVQRGSIAAGDYGGSKTDILQGQAIGDAADALARANAGTMGSAYSDAIKQASYAASAMPGAMQLGMSPYQYQQEVGGMEQGQEQQGIDEAMQRYYYDDAQQRQRLAEYNQYLQGGLSGFGQTTAGGGDTGGSPLAGALGGGLLGYGAASSIPALAGTTALGLGPIGLGVAGGAALLGGLFG